MRTDQDGVQLEPVTRRRRVPLVVVAGVLAAVSAASLALVVTGNADDDLPSASTVADQQETPDVALPGEDEPVEPGADTVGTAVPITTHEVFLARDPFDPVVPEDFGQEDPVDGDPVDPDDPDAVDPVDLDDPDGVVPLDPEDPDDPTIEEARSPCFGENEVVCDGQVVTLVEVVTEDDEQVAVIQVDTTVHEVRRGEVFADSFQLRAIDGGCVSLLYGDDGFQLCSGDTVLK